MALTLLKHKLAPA